MMRFGIFITSIIFILPCNAMEGEIHDRDGINAIFALNQNLNRFLPGHAIYIDNQLVIPIKRHEIVNNNQVQRTYTFERFTDDMIYRYALDTYHFTYIFDQNRSLPHTVDNPENYEYCIVKRELNSALFSHTFKRNVRFCLDTLVIGVLIFFAHTTVHATF